MSLIMYERVGHDGRRPSLGASCRERGRFKRLKSTNLPPNRQ
jgi:hypothetical protein